MAVALPAASAGLPWDGEPFSADPKVLLAVSDKVPRSVRADIEVLLKENLITLDADGHARTRARVVFRVHTEEGARSAALKVDWVPWRDERPEVRARVITSAGEVHELSPSAIESLSGNPEEPGRRIDPVALPAIGPGSIVEHTVTLRERVPLFSSGVLGTYYFGGRAPVFRSRITFELPASVPLKLTVRGAKAPLKQSKRGALRTSSVELGPLPPLGSPEALTPPDVILAPHLVFSTGKSWPAVAKAYSDLVDAKIAASDVRERAKQLAGNESIREVVAARCLAWLRRHIRIFEVELGEAPFEPSPPGETLERGSGDRKDAAVLLVALLRAAGLKANVALVGLGLHDLPPDLPGLGMLTHPMVVVGGKPELWIDPADPNAWLNAPPPPARLRQALVASASTRGLVRAPGADLGTNRVLVTQRYTLPEYGRARVEETREIGGTLAARLRDHLRAAPEAQRHALLAAYAGEDHRAQLVLAEQSVPDDFSRPFRVRLELSESDRGSAGDQAAAVRLSLLPLLEYLPEALFPPGQRAGRVHPLALPEPYGAELRATIVPAVGFEARPFQRGEVSGTLGPARLSRSLSIGNTGEVTAVLRFELRKPRLSASEVEELRAGLAKLAAAPLAVVFDRTAERYLASGRLYDGLKVHRVLVEKHPGEALHRALLGRALSRIGFGDEGRSLAYRAAVSDLTSSVAARQLGSVLERDQFGRRGPRAYDLPGAIAVFRWAKSLDPRDFDARAQLARALEDDPLGRRYGPGAGLAGAIEEYLALRSELGRTDLDLDLLFALLHARRYPELRELAPQLAASPARDGLLVAAIAASDGPAQAISHVRSRFARDADQVLEEAARRLLAVRLFPQAGQLAAAANSSDPALAKLQSRSVARHELSESPADRPEVPVRRLLAGVFTDVREEDLIPLFAARSAESALEEIRDVPRGEELSRALAHRGAAPQVHADLVLGGISAQVDGSELTGYRVELPGVAGEEVWFVARDGGQYRILGSRRRLWRLGLEALSWAERNDFGRAARLLDWARAEAVGGEGSAAPAIAAFLASWPPGGERSPRQARVGAACLAMEVGTDRAMEILAQERRLVVAPALARTLDEAIAVGYEAAGSWRELLLHLDVLEGEGLERRRALELRAKAMIGLEQGRELLGVLRAELARSPGDPVALGLVVETVGAHRDFDAAEQAGRKLLAKGAKSGALLNAMAWISLFKGPPFAQGLGWSAAAVRLEGPHSASALHTHAVHLAEAGKWAESRAALLRFLERSPGGAPSDDFWYAYGRLAEGLGLEEVARAGYLRVRDVPGERADHVRVLARRRLDALRGTSSGP
ncbi:MAG: DUF3857 domain-containing protein [Myxococcales bacterium]|nr:DUF3857 domain-containing protein [Myxococcales bacterium]